MCRVHFRSMWVTADPSSRHRLVPQDPARFRSCLVNRPAKSPAGDRRAASKRNSRRLVEQPDQQRRGARRAHPGSAAAGRIPALPRSRSRRQSSRASSSTPAVRRMGRGPRLPQRVVPQPRDAGLHAGADRHFRLLAEAAAVQARDRERQERGGAARRHIVGRDDPARCARPVHHRGVPEGARGDHRARSSRSCSSCRRRWSSCGTASSRCR